MFVDAYDKRTGKKLPHRVPESHLRIFSEVLSPTPRHKARTKAASAVDTTPEAAPGADNSEKE